ncbi:FmdB family zinc ribbon protein [Nitrosovibrio sp. Nv17]|uniref:FmdB family zinc ribbon protein n=1 Tax=Nitrosovibrio sp. Nv17 TaxID=1855339 RepID=UPI0009316B86|nr:zinc ribbon domain-containing protein [Nitrosovibrio sp. Nv17]
MPTYDYLCSRCDARFEARRPIPAPNPACLACGNPTEKIILSAPAIHGEMTRGREEAIRSLHPGTGSGGHGHPPGCGCGDSHDHA